MGGYLIPVTTRAPAELIRKVIQSKHRGVTGNVVWLVSHVRPDLCVTALSMAKRSRHITIKELNDTNRVTKIWTVYQTKWNIVGMVDPSFQPNDKYFGGEYDFSHQYHKWKWHTNKLDVQSK